MNDPTTRTWDIYPAIDLRQGRVVRLMQGDPDQETAYGNDPLAVAERWQDAGARWLHVVNLDGALDQAAGENLAALERILSTGLRVQFGGGMRDAAAIGHALRLGVERAIIGTAAVENPAMVDEVLAAHGAERIAVGIDARDGRVQTHGWQEAASMTAAELARHWAGRGLRWVIFTDVARDGMGTGVNLEATAALARETGLDVIASGGVASLEDVERVYEAGLSGVIIGRALYEGHVDLRRALAVGQK